MLMLFERPWLLPLGVVLPALTVVLLVLWHRRRMRRLASLAAPELVARLTSQRPTGGGWRRATLLGGASLCAAVAFVGPRWGEETSVVRGQGIDLALALDASLSMLATDERPNRLEKMKQEVRRLRALSPGDRFALLAFAGRSYILTPLTIDDGALDLFLDNLDPSVVARPGTSLERAIRQGTELLLASKTASDRALVVMSDGEGFDDAAAVTDAAKHAADAGITVITVGFGTTRGSTIPIAGDDGALTLKRDAEGEVVVTRYMPDMLRGIAEAAGGTFIGADETDKAGKIRRAIAHLRTQKRAMDAGANLAPRFQWFLVPALLLFLADTFAAERRPRRTAAPAAATTAAAIGLVFAFALPRPAAALGGTADADRAFRAREYARAAALYAAAIRAGDRSPETMYNYGTALLAADSVDSAIEPLERAGFSTDPDLRFRALFNLGLAHLKRGRAMPTDSARPALDAALASYRKALLIHPGDGDAAWNYELALKQRQRGGGGGGGGQPNKSTNDGQSPPSAPKPSSGLDRREAEQLLNSAAREERDVQGRKQKQAKGPAPPGGKD